jgi:hypothetical protein
MVVSWAFDELIGELIGEPIDRESTTDSSGVKIVKVPIV